MAGLFNAIGAGLNFAAGTVLANDLKDLGNLANTGAQQIGANAAADTAFTGYGVQTGLGNSTVDAYGNMNLGVGPDAAMQGLAGNLAGMSTGAFGDAMSMAQAGSYNPYAGQAASYFNNSAGPNLQQGLASQLYQQNASNPYASTASSMLRGSGQNAAYNQAMGGLGQSSSLAMQNAGNSQLGSALGGLNTAGGLTMAGSRNNAYGSAMGAQGNAMMGLGQQQSSSLSASQQAMQNAMADRAGREQEIYNSAMAMQQPGLDAQRASQQAREFAQGRGGVRGSQFGGTAEDAATARAQAQAQNQAAFQAMGQAESEMMNQAGMASQFGQLGQAAAGLQGNLGMNMGQLGAQNAQLMQSAGSQLASNAGLRGQLGAQQAQLGQAAAGLLGQNSQAMGSLGAQNAQLAQSAGQALGNLGAQNAQLGQSSAAGLGSLGGQLSGQQLQAGQALGNLGAQNAQLAQASGGMLANLGSQMGQLGQGYYGQSFLPLQQQLAAMEIGGQAADRFQTGQLTGANLEAQAGLTGLEAMINANKVGSELMGNMYGSAASALGGMGDADQGFFEYLSRLF